MRNMKRYRQKGFSTIVWILIVGLFSLIVLTFFKVFPMYYENYKVNSVLKSIQEDTSIDAKSKRAIWESMKKRMFIDEVRSIKRENVEMSRKDGKTTITVTYETRDTYFGNLFIGGAFSESIVVDR